MNMLKVIKGMSKLLIKPSPVMLQSSRSYAIAKRKLIRKEYFVYTPKMKSRYKGNPYPKLKLILLDDVENIGLKGDLVEVKRGRGRNDLIPNKLAVYATLENMGKFGMDSNNLDENPTSKVPQNVLRYLKGREINLVTPLLDNIHEETRDNWVITRHDIAEYFDRHAHLHVPVHCMKLVDLEDDIIRLTGTYIVNITINNAVTIPVSVHVQERLVSKEE